MTRAALARVAPAVAAALAGAVGACGGGGSGAGSGAIAAAIPVPPRAATAGEPLLALLPAGADVLVELDLARLYANPVVGDVARAALAGATADELAAAAPGAAATPLDGADAIVVATYGLGARAETITLVAGADPAAARLPGAVVVADGVVALGATERVVAVAAGGRSLAGDDALRALRARAMPAGADGAVLRVTARLGFDARVAAASRLGADGAPETLSLWADVADDLAVVALAEGADAGGGAVGDAAGRAMADGARAFLARAARRPELAALGLTPPVRDAEVEARGEGVRVVVLVGPRLLARAAARARAFLSLPGDPP